MTIQEKLKSSQTLLILALSMIFMAAFSRLIPHSPNFTAVTAMALFAGSQIPKRWMALLVPVCALFLSDLVLGFYQGMIFNYVAFVLITLASFVGLKNSVEKSAWMKIGLSSVAASLFFFTVSNFGVWFSSGMYSRDLKGLIACYIMGAEFLQNQIGGDLFFSAILNGLFFAAYSFAKPSVSDSSLAL